MAKQWILSALGVFLVWSGLDLVLHGVILRDTYAATAALWRPAEAMNLPLVYVVTFVLIACFVLIYQRLVQPKTLSNGIQYGAIWGLATGLASGFGTYIHMPIPLQLAIGWLIGGWVKGVAAGAVVGAVLTRQPPPEQPPTG